MPSKSTVAAILSVFLSGLGQIYLGHVTRGIAILAGGFLIGFITAYLIGLYAIAVIAAFWIWQIYDAYKLGKLSAQNPSQSKEGLTSGA